MTEQAREPGGRIVTFYSYKGGTGRTMALANAAWILAAAGRRVLMIDWDLEAPGLHRFFHPFLDPDRLARTSGIFNMIDEYCYHTGRHGTLEPLPEHWWADHARVADNAIPINWRFDDGGSLDFVSAARQGQTFSNGFTLLDWESFYNDLHGNKLLHEMRRHLKESYDYVLVDSRTGLSDIETICTKDLPDDLVICFTLSDQNIDGASDLAAHVGELTGTNSRRQKIRILPVVTRIEDADSDRLEVGLAVARARFAPYVRDAQAGDPNNYWNAARIPYRPRYAYEELLAVFGDAPGIDTSMLAACERLVGLITRGEVTKLPHMNEQVRLRNKASYTRARPIEPVGVYISSLSADQSWAAWLAWLLRGLGYAVEAEEPGAHAGRPENGDAAEAMRSADRTIAVVSTAYQTSPLGRSVWQIHQRSLDPSRSGRLIPLQVDEAVLGSLFRQSHPVDIAGKSEIEAVAALLRALGAPGATQTAEQALAKASAGGQRVRYPRATPAVWRAPNRMTTFTGREEALDTLRTQLGSGSSFTAVLPQAVYGLGGVGKTALALEYAYRNRHDYDVVWWIRAEQPNIANEDLAQLGEHLGLRKTDSIAAAADATREALRTGKPYSRWLLIFDNADSPEALGPVLPETTSGHVLVTSRNPAWATGPGALEVDPFQRRESVALLTQRVSGLSEAEADSVADELGDLPLAVEIAAAWLAETGMQVSDYVEQLRTETSPMLEASVVATWRIAIENIRRTQPAAVRLLQLFAFCGPEPIALDLVYGDAMVEALPNTDKPKIGRYIQELGRYSLIKVYRGELNAVQVHRLVQQVVREDITDPDDQQALRRAVHHILVKARPAQDDVDDPTLWPQYAKIWPHLQPSGAVGGNKEVRQLYVDRVRYLRTRGELRPAVELARAVVGRWKSDPQIDPNDAQLLSMGFELATALRAQGNVAESMEIDADVHKRQLANPDLGPEHVASLTTAAGLGADYRANGRFRDALDLDDRTYRSFVALYGSDYPRTLAAANNLAVSLRAVGRPFEALALDRRTYAQRLTVLGPTHPFTFSSAINLARDLRDCGDRSSYLELLARTYAESSTALGKDNPMSLGAGEALAIGLRKANRLDESAAILDELRSSMSGPNHAGGEPSYGFDLSVACDLSARGDSAGALESARSVQDKYARALASDHPDALVCMNNIAVYQRRLGDAEGAEKTGTVALTGLTAALGDAHLFTIACAINVANAKADLGRDADAEALYRKTLENLHTVLDVPGNDFAPEHPDLLACQADLAVVLREMGRTEEADSARAGVLATMTAVRGPSHPNTVALVNWRRIDRELDPVRL